MNNRIINKIKNIAILWTPPIVWMLIIFSFSAHPTGKVTSDYWVDFGFKKLAHIIEYALLTVLLFRGFRGMGVQPKRSGYASAIISTVYGITDEIHQMFTPNREPTIRDVLFDTIGSILAIYVLWILLPKMPIKLKELAKKLQLL